MGALDRRQQVIAGALALVLLLIVLPPLFAWQSENQQKALSLANMRRVATGCLVYAQDWDQRLPPPVQRTADGAILAWPRLVRQYVQLDEAFTNPSNPVKPFRSSLRDPDDHRLIETSYALNRRFWGEFAPGPFPFGNLEMPEQTLLLIEAGRMSADPRGTRFDGSAAGAVARDIYDDTTNRVNGLFAYPSTHGGQMGMVAADGHAIMTRVPFYETKDGPHDRLLGRVGEGIYNWNGGHDNGKTDTPAHE